MKERTQQTSILPIGETTAQLILQPTANLIESPLPRTPPETADTPYRSLTNGSRGDRFPTDSSLNISHTYTMKAKPKNNLYS